LAGTVLVPIFGTRTLTIERANGSPRSERSELYVVRGIVGARKTSKASSQFNFELFTLNFELTLASTLPRTINLNHAPKARSILEPISNWDAASAG
jgi:hypothetical protein